MAKVMKSTDSSSLAEVVDRILDVGIGQRGHHFCGPVGTTSVVAARIVCGRWGSEVRRPSSSPIPSQELSLESAVVAEIAA